MFLVACLHVMLTEYGRLMRVSSISIQSSTIQGIVILRLVLILAWDSNVITLFRQYSRANTHADSWESCRVLDVERSIS